MSEILPGVHVIDGVDPSPEFTTHVMLLKDASGGTYTLLDTGLPVGKGPNVPDLLQKYCDAHHIPFSSIKNILVTHLHADHTGNLKVLAQKTGAKVHAHWIEAAYLAGDPEYKGPGMPPPDHIDVHERLRDGATLDLFDGLVVMASPGHTPGHTAYYCPARKLLFAGDAVFNPGRLVITLKEYTFSQSMALISLRRLAGLDVESVIMYHGTPILHGAHAELRRAASEGYGAAPTT